MTVLYILNLCLFERIFKFKLNKKDYKSIKCHLNDRR